MLNFFKIAGNTFKESVREPIFALLLMCAVLLIANFPFVAIFVFYDQVKLVVDSSMATTMLFGLFAAVLCSSNTVSREMRDGTVLLLFHAHEALTNVRVESLTPNGVAYMPEQTLYTLPLLTPEKPLVIGVVYYGDMTAYGLSFTDATGTERHFAAYMSGRNGMLLLEEYYIN